MKKILITGGTRGIGRCCAELFQKNGYECFVSYINSDAEAKALSDMGITPVKADVSDRHQVEALYKQTGDVDILINNAGISWYGLLTDMTEQEWDRLFDVNVKGMFNCTTVFSPYMIRKKSGVIINVSSMWGVCGASCEVAYSASKAAVIGFTKALAKELAPSGVRVNCVAPGVIKTDMISNLTESDLKALEDETPLGKIGAPSDVADAMKYICEAEFVTGEILNVNGGFVL